MVSGFLAPGGKLEIPKLISDVELERIPILVNVDGRPIRDSIWLPECGKDNYWTGEKWYGKYYALPYQIPNTHFQNIKRSTMH